MWIDGTCSAAARPNRLQASLLLSRGTKFELLSTGSIITNSVVLRSFVWRHRGRANPQSVTMKIDANSARPTAPRSPWMSIQVLCEDTSARGSSWSCTPGVTSRLGMIWVRSWPKPQPTTGRSRIRSTVTFQKSRRPAPRSAKPRDRLLGLATNPTPNASAAITSAPTATRDRCLRSMPGRVTIVPNTATAAPIRPDRLPAPAAPARTNMSASVYQFFSVWFLALRR